LWSGSSGWLVNDQDEDEVDLTNPDLN
jgi:hypothetical protein